MSPGRDPEPETPLPEQAGERPSPSGEYRSELRAHLREISSVAPWRPKSPAALAAAYTGSGFVLLGLAAIGLAGVGPLA
jgi:hypothetical protein